VRIVTRFIIVNANHELARFDIEVDSVDDLIPAICLGDVFERHGGHGAEIR